MALEDTKEVFTCTNCGADVDIDASICPKCGASFVDDEEISDESVLENDEDVEEIFENRPVQSSGIECSYCGKKLSPTATMCPKCGTPIDNSYKKIKSTISSLILIGNIYMWLLIVCSVIYLILAIASESVSLVIVSIVMFACSFLAPVFFNWAAYVLKCLHDLTLKK